MGITIVLETEAGTPIETIEDPTNVLHRVLPSACDPHYQCLGVIDWYGDTTFNYLQIPRFLAEWSEIEKTIGEADRGLVVAIQKLAERLQHDRHLYLKFYGD